MTAATSRSSPLLVVVSIDTEEDNWKPARDGVSVTNIQALPELHGMLRGFGIRPTYFTSYAVARTSWAADIIGDLVADGSAEIGAHLHPWNTPPLCEPFVPRNTMMKNLPVELQAAKLITVTDTLEAAFGVRPTAFRAGRYGIGKDAAGLLADHGYTVDSSITPYLDWRYDDDGPDFRDAPMSAYRPSLTDITKPARDGPIIEVPVSVGYTRSPFTRWARWHGHFERVRAGRVSLNSLATRIHFLRRLELSPETATASDMLIVARNLACLGTRFVHVSWHSPSLVPGMSQFVPAVRERDAFVANVRRFFRRLGALFPVSHATVSEAAELLEGRHAGAAQHAVR